MRKFAKMDERAITPRRAHKNDAGLDLFALDDLSIRPGEVVKIHTGIQIELHEEEVGLFWDKSGRAANGLTILGGCIDGPYRGELIVVATNVNIFNTLEYLRSPDRDQSAVHQLNAIDDVVRIPYGKALTQILIISGVEFPEIEEISMEAFAALPATMRGSAGLGSSDHESDLIRVQLFNGPGAGQYVLLKGNEPFFETPFGVYYLTRRGFEFIEPDYVCEGEGEGGKIIACIDGPRAGARIPSNRYPMLVCLAGGGGRKNYYYHTSGNSYRFVRRMTTLTGSTGLGVLDEGKGVLYHEGKRFQLGKDGNYELAIR